MLFYCFAPTFAVRVHPTCPAPLLLPHHGLQLLHPAGLLLEPRRDAALHRRPPRLALPGRLAEPGEDVYPAAGLDLGPALLQSRPAQQRGTEGVDIRQARAV